MPSPLSSGFVTTSTDLQQPVRFGAECGSQSGPESDDLLATSCPERKKTLEERMRKMNEMVDAVFGPPKHELLKLLQRSPCSMSSSDESQSTMDPSSSLEDTTCTKHDFQETNSFRPCTCAHCNGLVSLNLIRFIESHLLTLLSTWLTVVLLICSFGDLYAKVTSAKNVVW